MPKGNYLSAILRSNKTVFSTKDIALLWNEPSTAATRVRLNYYVKKGDLYRIRKGLYAKDRNYNKLELATRIFTPSYVSFETVLAQEGLIFQYYNQIFVASYLVREITVDQQTYTFRKIKTGVLINTIGIENVNETSIATKERAFLDALYVNADYQFDNLRSLNWEKVFEILPIYRNQRMAIKVTGLYEELQDQMS
ncbi:MAG: type IV toxin-antitoxin system AbiEi family antitoxin domain-containing protein [Anaerolineales bacterium]|jgi:predicted transcriptional regulator of viral defense system